LIIFSRNALNGGQRLATIALLNADVDIVAGGGGSVVAGVGEGINFL
jgi:hypothetical protein